MSVFALAAGTQSYDWGKVGAASKAAQYAQRGIPGFVLDPAKPYAELWMGTHPTLPSRLLTDGHESLSAHLAANTALVGDEVVKRFPDAKNGDLPFLFKILAIRKALSIQAHPDKRLAERLHKERPDLYKDPNHKPEMAIALTPFTALCGFRPLPEISAFLDHVPELAALVDPVLRVDLGALPIPELGPLTDPGALRDVFASVMQAPPDVVATQLRALVARYERGEVKPEERELVGLVRELNGQFPGDVGVFCVFLLNVVRLAPGKALFLGAGEPHAYVAGDIVETMATSDNVLRAGLTPKMRDVPNLLAALTYRPNPPTAHLVAPTPFPGSAHTTLYNPPIPEFAVLLACVPGGEKETHRALAGPSVVIVTGGKGSVVWGGDGRREVAEGEVLFVGAGTEVAFEAAGEGELVLFRAFVEV